MGENMKNNGLVFVLSALLIVFVLFSFSQYYASKNFELNSSYSDISRVQKIGFIVDDIASDFNSILGTEIDFNSDSLVQEILIRDLLPNDSNKMQLTALKQFYDSNHFNNVNNFSLNTDNLTDGRTEIIFSNNLEYHYLFNSAQEKIDFFSPASDSDFNSIELNLTVNKDLNSSVPWSWNPSGDTDLIITLTDPHGMQINSSGKLSSAGNSSYVFNFSSSGDYLTVYFGGIDGNTAKLSLTESFAEAETIAVISIKTSSMKTSDLTAYYNSALEFSLIDSNYSGFVELK